MKKYEILYENGEKGLYEVSKSDTMISVLEELKNKKVKSIFVAGIEMKEKILQKSIVYHNGDEESFSSISSDMTVKDVIRQARRIDRDMDSISLDEKKIAFEDLREKDLKSLFKK